MIDLFLLEYQVPVCNYVSRSVLIINLEVVRGVLLWFVTLILPMLTGSR